MAEPILTVEHLVKGYGENTVLDDVSFSVRPGEVVVVVGPSGCGKSTLLRCINALEPTQSGRVRLSNETVAYGGKGLTSLRQRIGMVFQSFNLFPQYTALENVTLARELMAKSEKTGESHDDILTEGKRLLADIGLADRMSNYPHQLSGGQQQRVAIARALAMKPDILCFDEPTSALDPELTGEVLRVIRGLAQQHTTMIIVTHEMAFARDVADQVIFMDGGVIVEQGAAREVIDHPRQERTKQFLSRYSEI